MPRRREERLGGRHLDDPAEVHHCDPVAQVPHDGQVVGDEQQREAELAAQVLQQVQDRGLHADVESRHRLVGDEQLGPQRERPRDRDPLPLAAGELPRIGVHRVLAQPDEAEQLPRIGLHLGARHHMMHPQQLMQYAADGEARIQRGIRILENHLDLPLVSLRPAGRQEPAIQPYLAPVRP